MFTRSWNTGCWNFRHVWKLRNSGIGTGVDNLVCRLWASSFHFCFLNQMTFQSRQYCKSQASYVIYNLIFMLRRSAKDHLFSADRNQLRVMAPDSCLSPIVIGTSLPKSIYCHSDLSSPNLELCSVRPGRAVRIHVSRSEAVMMEIQSLIFISVFSVVAKPVIFPMEVRFAFYETQ